jgi:Arc/MetJ-type ribon-helix-helix transcriptional regulator
MAERAVSVQLDEAALRALEQLVADGRTQSDAVRIALVEAAARRPSRSLRVEAMRLAADPDDRREKAKVLAAVDELRAPW